VIADDHPFYREGMARLLRRSGIDVVAEVPNADAAIRAVMELAPDVVVMDLNMPGMSGLEATEHLAERASESRVLILSVSAQEPDLIDTLLAGARGYVLKDGPVEEVIAGIRAAAVDECFISPRLANVLLQRSHGTGGSDPEPGIVRLSSREHEVLGFLALGKASDEIAEMVGSRSDVVRGHITSILTKLQADVEERAAARAARGRRP
jgi:two-component system, NarL family, nitrate/nitrite response regulator NarL